MQNADGKVRTRAEQVADANGLMLEATCFWAFCLESQRDKQHPGASANAPIEQVAKMASAHEQKHRRLL